VNLDDRRRGRRRGSRSRSRSRRRKSKRQACYMLDAQQREKSPEFPKKSSVYSSKETY